MSSRLSFQTALLLSVPPLMWAGNAVVGRVLAPLCPPIMLNLLRWSFAALVLLPFAWPALRRGVVCQGLSRAWWPLALMGLLGIGCYNSFQYLALQTSTPLNVTLMASSSPVWIMLVGALFVGVRPARMQWLAALVSISGVLVVLTRGDLQELAQLRLVPGDLFMLVAQLCWAGYSWLLMRAELPAELRADWAGFLLLQLGFGVMWSGMAAVAEWQLASPSLALDWRLLAGLSYVVLGPALLAYRCWGLGVQRAGPTVAAFFSNLTPVFAAILSATLLGESPRPYHVIAFVLIVLGIVLSMRRGPGGG